MRINHRDLPNKLMFSLNAYTQKTNTIAFLQKVFQDLGHLYVDNAFKGYNSSVFAYGQTGSGKTFTMLGTAKNPGLIPRGCEELFRRIEMSENENVTIEIEASYLEVYMDQIFDLLADPEAAKKKKKSNKKLSHILLPQCARMYCIH